jgi:hypothetical protein
LTRKFFLIPLSDSTFWHSMGQGPEFVEEILRGMDHRHLVVGSRRRKTSGFHASHNQEREMPPELACLDFQECTELPKGTLVAPVSVLREIRCALGPTKLTLLLGTSDAVLVSSDLYEAFQQWEQAQDEEDHPDTDFDPSVN